MHIVSESFLMIVWLLTHGDLLFPNLLALLAVCMAAAGGAVDHGSVVDSALEITPKAYQITQSVPASDAGISSQPQSG